VKKVACIVMLAAVSLCVGWLASMAILAFEPQCGYDCETAQVGAFVLIEIICLSLFLSIGYIAFRRSKPTVGRLLIVSCVTSLVVLVPAWTSYCWRIHARYHQLKTEQSPKPSVDLVVQTSPSRWASLAQAIAREGVR